MTSSKYLGIIKIVAYLGPAFYTWISDKIRLISPNMNITIVDLWTLSAAVCIQCVQRNIRNNAPIGQLGGIVTAQSEWNKSCLGQ